MCRPLQPYRTNGTLCFIADTARSCYRDSLAPCVWVTVCSCLRRAAVYPVGVGVRRETACWVLVRGDVERVSLRDPARRQRLSPDRRKRRERRSVRLEEPTQPRQTRTNIHPRNNLVTLETGNGRSVPGYRWWRIAEQSSSSSGRTQCCKTGWGHHAPPPLLIGCSLSFPSADWFSLQLKRKANQRFWVIYQILNSTFSFLISSAFQPAA